MKNKKNFKQLFVAIFLIVIVGVVVGGAYYYKKSDNSFAVYTNDKYGFSIKNQGDWVISDHDYSLDDRYKNDSILYSLLFPTPDGNPSLFRRGITVTIYKKSGALKDFVRGQYEVGFDDDAITLFKGEVDLNGLTFFKVISDTNSVDGIETAYSESYFIERDSKVYAISAISAGEKENFEKYRKDFYDVINSFAFVQ